MDVLWNTGLCSFVDVIEFFVVAVEVLWNTGLCSTSYTGDLWPIAVDVLWNTGLCSCIMRFAISALCCGGPVKYGTMQPLLHNEIHNNLLWRSCEIRDYAATVIKERIKFSCGCPVKYGTMQLSFEVFHFLCAVEVLWNTGLCSFYPLPVFKVFAVDVLWNTGLCSAFYNFCVVGVAVDVLWNAGSE